MDEIGVFIAESPDPERRPMSRYTVTIHVRGRSFSYYRAGPGRSLNETEEEFATREADAVLLAIGPEKLRKVMSLLENVV